METSVPLLTSKSYPLSVEGACHRRRIFTVTRAFFAGYAILVRTHFTLCRRRHRLLTAGNAPSKTLSELTFNRCAGTQRMASCRVSTRWRKLELAICRGNPKSAEEKNKNLVHEFFGARPGAQVLTETWTALFA